ncbi:hypothetical protein [Zoogloea sp.]|uniref:hypothetical protein n=1 Tax=Zoogloea sp. TaxID=49181 RepID=UPI002629B1DC|nr:hypothetical protein [Zoogloea sp.]MDD3352022.1 hypothetical protein [Zoogloea sp.]
MDLQQIYTDRELEHIAEEAMLYMCACPGQVASEIGRLRELIRYQRACLAEPGGVAEVHSVIAEASIEAHRVMEECLTRVLELEGWDRDTLVMPEGLRRLRDDLIHKMT